MGRTFDDNMKIARAIKEGEISKKDAIQKLGISSSHLRTILKIYESKIKYNTQESIIDK